MSLAVVRKMGNGYPLQRPNVINFVLCAITAVVVIWSFIHAFIHSTAVIPSRTAAPQLLRPPFAEDPLCPVTLVLNTPSNAGVGHRVVTALIALDVALKTNARLLLAKDYNVLVGRIP